MGYATVSESSPPRGDRGSRRALSREVDFAGGPPSGKRDRKVADIGSVLLAPHLERTEERALRSAEAAGYVVPHRGLTFIVELDPRVPAAFVGSIEVNLAISGNIQELAFVVDDESRVTSPVIEHEGPQAVVVELAEDGFHALPWQTLVRHRIASGIDDGLRLLAPARFSWVRAEVEPTFESDQRLHLLDAIHAVGMPCVMLRQPKRYFGDSLDAPERAASLARSQVVLDHAMLVQHLAAHRDRFKVITAVVGDATDTRVGRCLGSQKVTKTNEDAIFRL